MVVKRELFGEGKYAFWVDGRLPMKSSFITRTSTQRMTRAGVDRSVLRNSPLYRESHRRNLDRYEYMAQILGFFLLEPRDIIDSQMDYTTYLLDPFPASDAINYLAYELATAKMYHKNKRNYRVFMVLSDVSDEAESQKVRDGIERMLSTVRYHVSSPDAFKDYQRFQHHIDNFLAGVTQFKPEDIELDRYVEEAGFRIDNRFRKRSSHIFDEA